MATRRDVQDIMGLGGADTPKTSIQKRPKAAAPQKKLLGVNREVAALYGERPPPVAIYEQKKTYRAKRQNAGPAKKWIQQPFSNPARSDGLILKHWRRKPGPRLNPENGEDVIMEDVENQDPQVETEYEFAKYNVQVEVPSYTDEEYEAHLRSYDWSREETEYLLQMVKEYYYRWPLIYDRYDFRPSTTPSEPSSSAGGDTTTNNIKPDIDAPGTEDTPSKSLAMLPFVPPATRTIEDLKKRYYTLSATLMKLHTPETAMNPAEYSLYETLNSYDPEREAARKRLAVALMNRSADEINEEQWLLAELQRINMSATKLDTERAELRDRLEAPVPNPALAGGLAQFQTSQALAALFAQLFQQDRSKKRQSGSGRLSLSATDIIGTPTSAHHANNAQHLSGSSSNRKTSLAQPGGGSNLSQHPTRNLPPQLEHRFNVSTHDRLTSGISFGSDKLQKLRQAKSNVQTQKIAAVLAQLGFPEIMPIPTARVAGAFEGLVGRVGKLLDVRKVREKEEGELRILEAMKGKRAGDEGGPGGGEGDTEDKGVKVEVGEEGEGTQNDNENENGDGDGADNDNDEGGEDDDGDGDDDADADDGEEDADGDGENDDNDIDDDVEGEEVEGEGAEADSESARQPSEAMSSRTGTAAPSASASASHKRSASVLSGVSNKSNKRVKK
ncbi:hypothetical protein K432DRAFT_327445 [Lepidopterella palustris CBS 459.81]|uniref:SWR1-complex protein 4 n=1 Tax=Lepidopterella palustris CBS 459.81 TaxID=1314670 RepID=A0A8E2JGA5_9PEZI|nr:hypothetical protein K432DRAFT_327445 [Lepidopterella palustris CBS 459.81]